MDTKEITGLPIQIINDSVLKICYVKMLTLDSVESIKLPSHFERYKENFLLDSLHVIRCELIKTRKNWILKHITSSEKLFEPKCYNDYLIHSEIIGFIKKYIKEDQETDILPFLVGYMRSNELKEGCLEDFEHQLLNHLGFHNLGSSITESKNTNNLM